MTSNDVNDDAVLAPSPPVPWPPDVATVFTDIFSREPRPCQVEFAHKLHDAIALKQPLLGELPTGVGKTLLAFYACYVARFKHNMTKAVIVAGYQKYLQMQYMEQASAFDGKLGCVFALFGKANYICTKRLKQQLDSMIPFAEANIESQRKRDKINKYFLERYRYAMKKPDVNDDIWKVSQQMAWEEASKQMHLSFKESKDVWSLVEANASCDCRKSSMAKGKFSSCPCARSRQLSKEADILVVNMSYVCTMASRGILDNLFTWNNAETQTTKFSIWDEAHAILHAAKPLYDSLAAPTLNAQEVTNLCSAMKETPLKNTFALDAKPFLNLEFEELMYSNSKNMSAVRRAVGNANNKFDTSACHTLKSNLEAIHATVTSQLEPFESAEELSRMTKIGAVSRYEIEAALKISIKDVLRTTKEDEPATEYTDTIAFLKEQLMKHEYKIKCVTWTGKERAMYDTCVLMLKKANNKERLDCEKLLTQLDALKSVSDAILTAKKALSYDDWNNTTYMLQAPIADRNGIHYHLSAGEKATAIKKLMHLDMYPPIMISATLCDENGFEMFESAIGYTFPTAMKVKMHSPFPDEHRFFWSPSTMYRPFEWESMSTGFQDAWHEEQAALIVQTLQLMWPNRRLALVISKSNRLSTEMMQRISVKLPTFSHTKIESTEAIQHVKVSEQPGVIYGTDTLATGVDLPGQVGLVVILKPLNMSLSAEEQYALKYLKVGPQMWKNYYWNASTIFRQACGRLMRRHDDKGVILFFDTLDKYNRPKGKERDNVYNFFEQRVSQDPSLVSWPF